MKHSLGFWLAVLSVIAFAVGTAPIEHGIVCWLIGTGLLLGVRYADKKGW